MDEVNVEAVDLRDEVGNVLQPRLQPSEVVPGAPVASECLDRRELYALRLIGDGLLLGPTCRLDAAAEIGEVIIRKVDLEGANVGGGLDAAAHGDLRST